jgi:putative ABC transport system permease protein
MNLLRLSWKNLTHQPWSTGLSLVLAALGAGLISLLLQLNHQLDQQFQRNLAGIDLVVGAKGSPLQLILSGMYHIDAPTGNIPIAESKAFLNPRHPLIKKAVPLSLGDSHRGHRIVGTTYDFLDLYEAEIAQGKRWEAPLEVVAGAAVADKLGLRLGDTFKSSHGLIEDEDLVHADADAFRVVGILKPTGSVADQLLLTSNESLWVVHEHHADHTEASAPVAPGTQTAAAEGASDGAADEHAHGNEHGHADEHAHEHGDENIHADEHAHEHGDEHAHTDEHAHEHASQTYAQLYPPGKPLMEYTDKDITLILVQFKGRNAQTLNFPRNINENTNLQAAVPAIEISRLYATMGAGEQTLRWLAAVIIIVSILSIFISLYANLDNRRYELALMRVMGASRSRLFSLLLLEGSLLAFIGSLLGLLLSHGGLSVVADYFSDAYRYDFQAWALLPAELQLLGGALLLGVLASLVPALRASRTDIHKTLAE